MIDDRRRQAMTLRDRIGRRLATLDALPQIASIAVVCGLSTGGLMVFFRLCIEGLQSSFLPDGVIENYEGLSPFLRLLLAVGGGFLIACILNLLPSKTRSTGIVHVVESLQRVRGRLPLGNALWQFLGALLAIVSGQSVGREGPSVHLGAAVSYLFGDWLRLPRSSIRTLVACGVAAAIAASFNTPLAGVVFSMEVVMAEYTVSGFVPVILAAVSATSLMQVFYGTEPAFILPALEVTTTEHLPYIVALGVFVGLLATAFNRLVQRTSRWSGRLPGLARTTLAGLVTGLLAVWWPEIMGIGYDTVEVMLDGRLGLAFLLALALAKLVATAVAIGTGIPAGLIGPVLFIGAAAGGVVSHLGLDGQAPLFVMLGMGAMMAATLHAPLAALTAMIELTASPAIILPGMLAVITAVMTSQEVFHCPSIFAMLLRERGVEPCQGRVSQWLRSVPVSRIMHRDVVTVESSTPVSVVRERCSMASPSWCVLLDDAGRPVACLAEPALAKAMAVVGSGESATVADLGLAWLAMTTIDLRADAAEAIEAAEHSGVEILVVVYDLSRFHEVVGVVTRDDITAYYRS